MSGWTAMTVHPPNGLSDDACDQACEAIEEGLEELYEDKAGGYAERTVQLERGVTYGNCGDGKNHASDVFENIPESKYVVIVSANDTSMCGDGVIYKREDGETVCMDTKNGYEGANGNDVVGYFRDEYSLRGYSSFEA